MSFGIKIKQTGAEAVFSALFFCPKTNKQKTFLLYVKIYQKKNKLHIFTIKLLLFGKKWYIIQIW